MNLSMNIVFFLLLFLSSALKAGFIPSFNLEGWVGNASAIVSGEAISIEKTETQLRQYPRSIAKIKVSEIIKDWVEQPIAVGDTIDLFFVTQWAMSLNDSLSAVSSTPDPLPIKAGQFSVFALNRHDSTWVANDYYTYRDTSQLKEIRSATQLIRSKEYGNTKIQK